jgi:hypothetical protein
MEAGTTISNHNFATVALQYGHSVRPVVIAQSQTINESDAVVTRIRNVSQVSFQVKLKEEESKTDGHAAETVGYIALSNSSVIPN